MEKIFVYFESVDVGQSFSGIPQRLICLSSFVNDRLEKFSDINDDWIFLTLCGVCGAAGVCLGSLALSIPW